MADNTLDQIKQSEAEAKKMIEQTGQEVENMVLLTKQNGEKSLSDAENLAAAQLKKILEEAKTEIQKLKHKKELELAAELKKINGIDSRQIDQAAELVFKEISK